jgi:hypothetical protein
MIFAKTAKIHAKTFEKFQKTKSKFQKIYNVKTTAICRVNSWFDCAHQS